MTIEITRLDAFPEEFRSDIERAVAILKEGGCTEVHVFGSVAEGRTRSGSDIDMAVRGCPPQAFFELLGRLLSELDHSVDLIDLDMDSRIGEFLQRRDLLVHVG